MNIPCDMLVFGGTGDLALHKLLPALYHLHRDGRLPADMRILALARNSLNRSGYCAMAEKHCRTPRLLRHGPVAERRIWPTE